MSVLAYIFENLEAVRGEIAAAEREALREGKTKMIVAVKYGEAAELEALLALGVNAVGENRVQQLLEHWPLFEKSGAEVHFIGSLQTNKVKYIIDKVKMIHSVDSLRLAAEIDKRAAGRGIVMDVLVEINGAREEAKSGVMPEDETVEMLGKSFPCVDGGFEPGEEVDIVVRPEDIMVVGEDVGQLTGEVVSVLFKGVHYEMMVRTEGYVWKVHSTTMQPVGTRVGLTIVPFNIHIMRKGAKE